MRDCISVMDKTFAEIAESGGPPFSLHACSAWGVGGITEPKYHIMVVIALSPCGNSATLGF